jgi:hypothetical protein
MLQFRINSVVSRIQLTVRFVAYSSVHSIVAFFRMTANRGIAGLYSGFR